MLRLFMQGRKVWIIGPAERRCYDLWPGAVNSGRTAYGRRELSTGDA
jgi:hypothetical protein